MWDHANWVQGGFIWRLLFHLYQVAINVAWHVCKEAEVPFVKKNIKITLKKRIIHKIFLQRTKCASSKISQIRSWTFCSTMYDPQLPLQNAWMSKISRKSGSFSGWRTIIRSIKLVPNPEFEYKHIRPPLLLKLISLKAFASSVYPIKNGTFFIK